MDYSRVFAVRHQRARTVAEDVEAKAFDLIAFQVKRPSLIINRDDLASHGVASRNGAAGLEVAREIMCSKPLANRQHGKARSELSSEGSAGKGGKPVARSVCRGEGNNYMHRVFKRTSQATENQEPAFGKPCATFVFSISIQD